jgi:type I restriction enzyme S subunit
MTLETFFEKFDVLANAPNGVAKMRELVLELGVQGKLVEQNSSDVPALDTLRQSAKGVCALVIRDEETVPVGWVSVPLGCVIASNIGGGTPSKQNPAYWDGSIPWASVKDIQADKYLTGTIDTITDEGLRNSSSNLIPVDRLIVVTRMGLGKLAINKIPVAINQDLRAIEPNESIDLDFAYLLFRALKLVGKGVTVKGVTVEELHSLPISLPPLAEQKRIVAKVDELMALCDLLEAQQQERETRYAALARASLARFANEPTPANLELLFHKSYSIPSTDLRKTILTLAVQGKLVPQDPNDGETQTVSMEELVGRKNLKNGLSLSPIDGASDFVCLPLSAMKGSTIDCSFGKPIVITADRAAPYLVKPRDIFIIRGNGSKERVGISGMVRSSPPNVLFPDLFIRVPLPPDKIDGDYFLIAWNSPVIREMLESLATTTSGIWKVNQGHISECEIPLPPIAEQRRIVAKVDELMALVDTLESQLATARITAEQLMEAVVAELTTQD